MIFQSLSVRGMAATAFIDRYDDFYAEMVPLVQSGAIKADETVYRGFDKIPEAFAGQFLGHNTGKAVVVID